MSADVWVRPRDRKSKVVETWKGRGGHGEGKEEEEDPGRPLRLEAAEPGVEIASVDRLEPVGVSWDRGVDRGEEALLLPDRRRRRLPCEQA